MNDHLDYDSLRADTARQVAKLMAAAAITAPKSGGQLFLADPAARTGESMPASSYGRRTSCSRRWGRKRLPNVLAAMLATGEKVRKRTDERLGASSPRRKLRSRGSPATALRTRRSAPGCSSARARSSTTDIVAAAADDPSLRERTWVLLSESPEGGWGIGGHANTNAEIAAAARAALASQ